LWLQAQSDNAQQLASRGYSPVLRRFVGKRLCVAGALGALEQLDVRDAAGLDDVFRRHQPAAGMHFTAYIQVGDSVRKPLGYHRHAVEQNQ
jgi:UDP-glucose 4-epimerase